MKPVVSFQIIFKCNIIIIVYGNKKKSCSNISIPLAEENSRMAMQIIKSQKSMGM